MTAPTTATSTPVTSWWYGQGRAVDVARRLESLYSLTPPPPGPPGLITARRDELVVTFVAGLKSPLPYPWRPADSTNEARIPWEAVDPGLEPDPDRPVYLVVFGTTGDGGLVGLNLAAFQRIRVDGEPAVTSALVGRWVLELLSTHPDITIGVTPDVWRGPLTTRVQPVAVGSVPHVDVLVCGPDLSYTDRAQIVSNASSKIMVDLGKDAAVDTKWTITCGPDRLGQISNGITRPMSATLILPSPAVVDRCADLVTGQGADAGPAPTSAVVDPLAEEALPDNGFDGFDGFDDTDTDPRLPVLAPAAASDPVPPEAAEPIDFFSEPGTSAADGGDSGWPDAENMTVAPEVDDPAAPAPAADGDGADGDGADLPAAAVVPATTPSPVAGGVDVAEPPAAVEIAPIWNRILGQVDLSPPHTAQEPGPREKRLNELTVFLQHNRFADSTDIIRAVYNGGASGNTVTQQISLLRARLGVIRVGGPKALPPMKDSGYVLDNAVRSDWMEFERLVEILIDTTPTAQLDAAMSLVTGPPLGGVPPREWEWTKDLRDEIRDRVAGAAVVLAGRHHSARKYGAAVEIARKGLWYDSARQDLWRVGMQAALDGHDREAHKALRSQYLSTVAGPDRDPAVLDLTKQAG